MALVEPEVIKSSSIYLMGMEEGIEKGIEKGIEEKEEEPDIDEETLAAIEKAEQEYLANKKAASEEKEPMPIGVGSFAAFPYKRTYCGSELIYTEDDKENVCPNAPKKPRSVSPQKEGEEPPELSLAGGFSYVA